jgi:hypothetical protein
MDQHAITIIGASPKKHRVTHVAQQGVISRRGSGALIEGREGQARPSPSNAVRNRHARALPAQSRYSPSTEAAA